MHSSSFLFVKIWPAFFFALRSVVRRAASLLSKVVDSLAPSITNVLVQGKQVSIRSPHHSHSSFCLGHLDGLDGSQRDYQWLVGSSKVSFLKQKRCTHSLKAVEHLVGHLIFRPAPWDCHFQPPCLLEFSAVSSVENRLVYLVGHLARIVMLRAE